MNNEKKIYIYIKYKHNRKLKVSKLHELNCNIRAVTDKEHPMLISMPQGKRQTLWTRRSHASYPRTLVHHGSD
jgi:hypothetical protein